MYSRILLASDGSRDSLVALREGALIARSFSAKVFLLIIELQTAGLLTADGVYPTPRSEEAPKLLKFGLSRLSRLGVTASGDVALGDPASTIAIYAKRFAAELVVVGHRRQSLVERWWSGASGAYLVDHLSCSVLLARNVISDEEFEAKLVS
jgi:nucleotide-binding universal stress UspA family protein